LHEEEFPIFTDTDRMLPMFVDANPFLFGGNVCKRWFVYPVRQSSTSPLVGAKLDYS